MIEEIVNELSKNEYFKNEIIGKPATDDDLKLCIKRLTEMGFKIFSNEYEDFLKKYNGFYPFFGTKKIKAPHSDYIHNDIISANEEYKDKFEDCVLIGKGEDYYVYNIIKKHYEIRDRYCYDVNEKFDTFELLFKNIKL